MSSENCPLSDSARVAQPSPPVCPPRRVPPDSPCVAGNVTGRPARYLGGDTGGGGGARRTRAADDGGGGGGGGGRAAVQRTWGRRRSGVQQRAAPMTWPVWWCAWQWQPAIGGTEDRLTERQPEPGSPPPDTLVSVAECLLYITDTHRQSSPQSRETVPSEPRGCPLRAERLSPQSRETDPSEPRGCPLRAVRCPLGAERPSLQSRKADPPVTVPPES